MSRIGRYVLTLLCLMPASLWAQDNTEAAKNTKPEVVIDPSGLPPDVLEVVQKGVGAIVRQADDQDGGEAARIRRKGHDAVVSALATKGYFDPVVTLEVGEDIGGDTWDISIEPGEISKVTHVDTLFKGRILAPEYSERVESLRQSWGLPVGEDFINARWSSSKTRLLDQVQAQDFFLARLAHSQAVVNPETSSVATTTLIDSGPSVTLGHIEVIGLRRVPASLVNRYVQYAPGTRFKQKMLDEWQQQLQSTNFFRGAFVNLKTPPGEEIYQQETAELPVTVRVTEGPARVVTGSFGIDDVVGGRLEGMYEQRVIFGLPIIFEAGAGVDKDNQRLYTDFYLPPNEDGSVDSLGLMARRTDISNEKVTSLGLGWRRKHEFKLDPNSRVEWERNFSILATYDSVKRKDDPVNPEFKLPAVVASYDILRRDVDSKYDPRSGNLVQVGVGIGRNLKQNTNFARASARGQVWFPMGRRDVVTVRAEVGKVWAADDTIFPDDFGYRTGGARTIRGYKYYGIGNKIGDTVIGTRALAVASVEYMHYFDDVFGMGVFVDVGDAAPSFRDMKLHAGYGVGALIKTPAGPINIDLAYGQRDKKLRLHFSLGIAF